jgi:hypothetical protein
MPQSLPLARFAVRLNGLPVEGFETHEEALAAARNLKSDLPDQLVTVWDLAEGNGDVVESQAGELQRTWSA